MTRLGVVALLALVVGSWAKARPARAAAGDVVVGDLYAEPDLRAEAGAVTLLLRAMLGGEDPGGTTGDWRTLARAIPGEAGLWADAGAARALLGKLGAGFLVTGSVASDGVRLVVTVRVTDAKGTTKAVISARGWRSDPAALARELAVHLGVATGRAPGATIVASAGELRPSVLAGEALRRGDGAAATAALLGADPAVAARVPPARAVARAVWADAARLPDERLAAAAQAAPPEAVLALADELGGKASPSMRAAARARALVALDRLKDAEAELGSLPGAGGEPVLRLARAQLAHATGDFATRDAELAVALDARYLPALRFAAGLPGGTLPKALEDKALAAAEQIAPRDPALAAALGFRAASASKTPARALALVQLGLLPAARVEDLAKLVAGLPESAAQRRLLAELRAHAGELDGAVRDAARAVELAPRDVLALITHARLLTATGRHAEAVRVYQQAVAKEPSPLYKRELARAMLAAGDFVGGEALLRELGADATSVESARALARRLIAEGKTAQALALLEQAGTLSGADAELLRALADTYTLAGDDKGAARAQLLAGELGKAESVKVAAAPLDLEAAAAAAKAARKQAGQLDLDAAGDSDGGRKIDARKLSLLEPAADELATLLEGFPELADSPGRRVAVAPLATPAAGFWWPWQADPRRTREALEVALGREPLQATLGVGHSDAPVADPPAREALAQLAADGHAEYVLLYGVRAGSGGKARVKLVLYDAAAGEAKVVDEVVARGRAVGLTRWNRSFFNILAILGVLLVGAGALAWWRGTGSVQVRIKLDPAASEDAYCVRVSKETRPPRVDEPVAWTKQIKAAGLMEGKREHHLARASTTLHKIPAGRWNVHLWGTHAKGGELRVLPELTREVRVGRGKTAHVEFDLVPAGAEYRVGVFDGHAPAAGAKVWFDDQADKAVTVDEHGKALVIVPKGSHILRVMAGGLRIEKPVEVMSTKVFDLSFNLERERRLRDHAGGIELAAPDAATALGPIVSAAGVELAVAPATPAASAAPRVAAGSAPSVIGDQEANPGFASTRALKERPTGAVGSSPSPAAVAANPALASASPAPASASTPTGKARYQPVAELGRGAMGVVFRARDAVLERDVALKIISDEVKSIPQVLELFMQEARALAALNHPNVVAVYDQGFDADGHAFMVMEFVEGTTLESLLEKAGGALPLDEALPLADQLLAGVGFAHGRRVIHRDIKPANIFVSNDGIVKLGDFGLARVVRELRIHRTEIRGTPLYMAPEQIHGSDIDHRADLYAVGCTIMEMLTGRPPFLDGDVMYHHVHTAPPRPSEMNPNLPPELDGLVLACLAKKKEDRVPSAEELRRRLKPIKARYT